jgi:RNA polymerase sigma-B factor
VQTHVVTSVAACARTRFARRRIATSMQGAGGPGLSSRDRDELVIQFMPLAHKLARRYLASGEPYEDLVQIASLGLVNAARRFDPDRGTAFTTFAVPTITGELNRYLRDATWALHVDRGAKERARDTAAAEREISATTGHRPSVQELAQHLGCDAEAVVDGLRAAAAHRTVSLDAPAPTADPGLHTRIDELGGSDRQLEQSVELATIFAAARQLTRRERLVLYLRFGEDLPQTEIAQRVGVSQMHVSRIIRDSLARLRELAGEPAAA